MANRGRPRVKVTGMEVADLKTQEFSYRQVARKLGIGKTTACDLLKQAQNRGKTPSEKSQEARSEAG